MKSQKGKYSNVQNLFSPKKENFITFFKKFLEKFPKKFPKNFTFAFEIIFFSFFFLFFEKQKKVRFESSSNFMFVFADDGWPEGETSRIFQTRNCPSMEIDKKGERNKNN